MFPLHQGNKLVFQISSSKSHHLNSSEDRILGYASPDGCSSTVPSNNNNNKKMGKSRRRKLVVADLDQIFIENSKDNKKKKMMIHRENERQRRQEMATLCSSLRSLLPLEFIKGKRSTSDQMNEAVNYIKHLQNRIKTLDARRDELEKFPKISTVTDRRCTTGISLNSDKANLPSCFRVHPCFGGVEIVVRCGIREDGLPFISISKVLEMLLEQGLTVVSCVSTNVNERLLHTIQSEVIDVESLELSGLEQKLAEVLPTSRTRKIEKWFHASSLLRKPRSSQIASLTSQFVYLGFLTSLCALFDCSVG